MKKIYRNLILIIITLFILSKLYEGFIGPIAFVTGIPDETIWQGIAATYTFFIFLLIAVIVQNEFVHGYLERVTQTKIPALIGNVVTGFVLSFGVCIILSLVFDQSISTLLATLAGSLALLGFALKDYAVALVTGLVLNVEKSFKVGDEVSIDGMQGTVSQITWRNTVLTTSSGETIFIPNVSIFSTNITNFDLPNSNALRTVEITIDYDISVESVERIMYAAVLSAKGPKFVGTPSVFARKLLPNGILYEVQFTIEDNRDGLSSDHAVIRSILDCMRKSDISVTNRSSDLLYLVQQVKLFNQFSNEQCLTVTKYLLERRYAPLATIVHFSEVRNSLFIIAEGIVKCTMIDSDDQLIDQNYISTEFFGSDALFACLPQKVNAVSQSDVLTYEITQEALQSLFNIMPELKEAFAKNLALIQWKALNRNRYEDTIKPEELEPLENFYSGQIYANYGKVAPPKLN